MPGRSSARHFPLPLHLSPAQTLRRHRRPGPMGGVKNRSSYASPCAQLRAAYHDCFNRWYSEKFSKGQWDKEECVEEWEKYRACLAQHLEDKHLRRLFVEADAAAFFKKDESAHPVDGNSGR